MTVREAMNTINGALDALYEYYGDNAEAEFEEIGLAEAILEKLVQKEEKKPKEYWAVCPKCGHELHYDTFDYDGGSCEVVFFLASGCCPHCEKKFDWRESFELIDIEYDED